jgi:dihydrofolate reductase
MAKVSIIVAIDEKLGIGAKNRMLWHISKDFKHFKTITDGHPIIMGRKTFESIGRVLPGRTNIIITRDASYRIDGAQVVDSLEKAIELGKAKDKEEIFIIGGGEIFRQAIEKNLVDKLYLTKIKGDFNAKIFFPEYEHIFTKVVTSRFGLEGNYRMEFQELER